MEEVGWRLDPNAGDKLAASRRRIDQIDEMLSALLAERLDLARELRQLKADLDLPVQDPSREADVRARVAANTSDPEIGAALQRIYDGIIEQSCLLQAAQPVDQPDKGAVRRPSISYFPRVLIVGLGLIGGALARQVKLCLPDTTILAVDKPEILQLALSEGVIDGGSADPLDLLHRVSLVILAAKPAANLQILEQLAPHLNKGQLVVDVTSAKGPICELSERLNLNGADFIGGHPFFGSEKSGFENSASVDLKNKLFCLVPGSRSSQISLKRLSRWLTALQLRVEITDATSHDQISARISHLVQLLSVALGNCINQDRSEEQLKEILKISGTSFGQVARLMSSPPELWLEILEQNRNAVDSSIDELVLELKALQKAIAQTDRTTIAQLFERAAAVNRALCSIDKP